MRRLLVALATVALLTAFTPSLAVAEQPDVYVYHGVLTGERLNDCPAGSPWGEGDVEVLTQGIWTATISPGMTQISANMFHDFGAGWVHWSTMGGAAWGDKWVLHASGPGSFHMSMFAFDTTDVDATLRDGVITFHVEPALPTDCPSADVRGVVTWSGPKRTS